ncbi:MAG: S8/S53 family peptidase [Burkholderiales bacterium]|nr:S8/S53 family peptidase [Burkholderiales bacterium]
MARHTIPGSERQALEGARAIGPARPDERIEVTLRLRARTSAAHALSASGLGDDTHPGQRRYLTRAQYAASHGADAHDIASVAAFAKAHGLSVVESDEARRSVVLSGSTQSMNDAFGVQLQQFEHAAGTYRGRTGPVSVPSDLAGIVEGVFGLDDRPAAEPHFQRYVPVLGMHAVPAKAFTPPALARLYDFPTDADGSGQCIGIIELGGGYRPADITAYFASLGIPSPKVKSVLVDHAKNHPTNASSADGEVMLDIEVAAAVAPKATIAVYFAPNTTAGFLDAITKAVHDDINKPSVISISWGASESNWTAQAMTQYDQAFQAAAAMGVTICAAAGDNGSSDGVPDGKAHVDFPSSSPNVLACGGTKLLASSASKISSEVVWNEGATTSATGGGVSGFFALPSYQAKAGVPVAAGAGGKAGRGVPDVAGDADPATGYEVRVDGENLVIGGTSAVAPLWAGLVALLNQKLGHPVGLLNPLLYGSLTGKGATHDITSGNNGSYSAKAGWDPCTGWGSPNGAKLVKALGT